MNKLVIPDTGKQLVDGSIVMLARFPGTKWIVHDGWYMHYGKQYRGWYFCSIPANTIIPVNDDDLRLLTVVSGCPCPPPPGPGPCPPPHPCPPPDPHHDCPVIFTERDKAELSRSWLVVETLAQRDKLNRYNRVIPNGKIVRVNNTGEGIPKYYRWDSDSELWVEENLGFPQDKYLTTEESDARYASKDELGQVDIKVDELQESLDRAVDRIDGLEEKTDSTNEAVASSQLQISELSESVLSIESRLDDVDSSIVNINQNLEVINTTLNWQPIKNLQGKGEKK